MTKLLSMLWSGTKTGARAVATGNTQATLGLQSPYLPTALVRVGRFLYISSAAWISATWYSGWVNEHTSPGSGPTLLIPGGKYKKKGGVNRPLPSASWAATGGAPGRIAAATGQQHFGPSGNGGGFLPKNAKYIPGRHDQGQDGQTDPGGPIIAPGSGYVLHVLSDPNGFGPDYPVVKFSSGPYASGPPIYIGHTHSALRPGQRFGAGQVLSHTGTSGVGNATTPGWFEIGYAPGGYPGVMGQRVPF